MIESRDVALLLFSISAGEALAFLLGLWVVWRQFDDKLNDIRIENHKLQAQVDKLTNILVANYGIRIDADEVNMQDLVGRDKGERGQ